MPKIQFVVNDRTELFVRRNNNSDTDKFIGEINSSDRDGMIVWTAYPEWGGIEMGVDGFSSIEFASVFCAQMALQEKEIDDEDYEVLNNVNNSILFE